MASDHASEACAKYAESQRLDPQLGTLLHLGACYEKVGKTASAWAAFKDAADIAARKHDERESAARARIAELDPRLSRLTIEVLADAPGTIEIKRDGEAFGRAAWGSSLPIDPGPHVITASAAGYKDWQTTIDVPASASNARVSVPKLEPLSGPAQVLPPAQPGVIAPGQPAVVPQAPAPAQATQDKDSSGSGQRIAGFALAGVGVVGLAVGTVAGLSAHSKVSDRDSANACSSNGGCTLDQSNTIKDLTHSARTMAGIANVGFIAGGAALVGGVILIVTGAPKETKTAKTLDMQPWVGAGSGGLIVGGAW